MDINSSGDLLLGSDSSYAIYRDDWGELFGYVKINDLVVGEEPDMATWSSGSAHMAWGGLNDSGQITGNFSDGRIFVLTLEPLEP